MCWLTKMLLSIFSATVFFRCAPTARTIDAIGTTASGSERRVSTRATQHHLATAHDANDRIIDVPNDRPVVNEKHVGDPAKRRNASCSSMQIGSSLRFPLVATIGKSSSLMSK